MINKKQSLILIFASISSFSALYKKEIIEKITTYQLPNSIEYKTFHNTCSSDIKTIISKIQGYPNKYEKAEFLNEAHEFIKLLEQLENKAKYNPDNKKNIENFDHILKKVIDLIVKLSEQNISS